MKYRLKSTGEMFDSLEALEDSLMPKNPQDFTLVPDITKNEYDEIGEFMIIPDDFPDNPMNDTVFNWVTAHRRYYIGNVNFSNKEKLEDFIEAHKKDIEWSKKNGLYHTIFMYDHSGITLVLDGEGFHDWDYGQLGFVFTSKEDILCAFNWHKITKKRIALLKDMLQKEFQALKNYTEGDCYVLYSIDEEFACESGTRKEIEEIFEEQYSKNGILVENTSAYVEV